MLFGLDKLLGRRRRTTEEANIETEEANIETGTYKVDAPVTQEVQDITVTPRGSATPRKRNRADFDKPAARAGRISYRTHAAMRVRALYSCRTRGRGVELADGRLRSPFDCVLICAFTQVCVPVMKRDGTWSRPRRMYRVTADALAQRGLVRAKDIPPLRIPALEV